jgi:hypothetical protein
MWYFFVARIALCGHMPRHCDLFRLALGKRLITTIAELILHHGQPKAGLTGRLLRLHVSAVGLTAVLWEGHR